MIVPRARWKMRRRGANKSTVPPAHIVPPWHNWISIKIANKKQFFAIKQPKKGPILCKKKRVF